MWLKRQSVDQPAKVAFWLNVNISNDNVKTVEVVVIKAHWHAQHIISPYPGSLRTGYTWWGWKKSLSLNIFFICFWVFFSKAGWVMGQHLHKSRGTSGPTWGQGEEGDSWKRRGEKNTACSSSKEMGEKKAAGHNVLFKFLLAGHLVWDWPQKYTRKHEWGDLAKNVVSTYKFWRSQLSSHCLVWAGRIFQAQ